VAPPALRSGLLPGLVAGPDEHFVDRYPAVPRDDVGDRVGDVLRPQRFETDLPWPEQMERCFTTLYDMWASNAALLALRQGQPWWVPNMLTGRK